MRGGVEDKGEGVVRGDVERQTAKCKSQGLGGLAPLEAGSAFVMWCRGRLKHQHCITDGNLSVLDPESLSGVQEQVQSGSRQCSSAGAVGGLHTTPQCVPDVMWC
jgi:hypothetical protein